MVNLLEDIKNAVDTLLGHAQEVKTAVDAATAAPNVEAAFVDAVIVALEAMGYTVTPPAKQIPVQDGNEPQA